MMIFKKTDRLGTAALLSAMLTTTPAYGFDFFWSATAQTFGWFDRETPEGPPGFSPWTLGAIISGEAPDDAADRAFLSTSDKTTTLGTSVTVGLVTINGANAILQMNGGALTTVDGFVINSATGELAFTAGTVNNSTGGMTNLGVIRGLSGTGNLSGDVNTSGQVIVGNAATLNFAGTNATLSQTAGSFDVVAGGTANFTASGYSYDHTGGTLDVDGTLNINNGSTFTLNGGSVNASGTFRINSGGTFNHISGAITGEVELVNNNSTLNLMTALNAPPASVGAPVFRMTGNGSVTGDIHQAVDVIIANNSSTVTVGLGAATTENRGDITLASNTFGGFSALNVPGGGVLDNNGGTVRAMFSPGATTDRRLTSSSSTGLLTNRGGGQVIIDPGVDLLLAVDVDNTADVTIGTGATVDAGSNVAFNMAGGTLTNNGTLQFSGGGGPSVFRYSGGTISGNPIAFNFGTLELLGGSSPATFHFLGGGNNQTAGDIAAGQTLLVDADIGDTAVSRGTGFATDNSFTSAGTLRLTGADVNDSASFFMPGNTSVFTNTGLIHAQGVPGSANLRVLSGSNGGQLVHAGTLNIDPDTTLQLGLTVTNTGDVNIGANATLDMDTTSNAGHFTHNAGAITNNGTFKLDNGSFTFNGGTIAGNTIELEDAVLTLGPASGPASFILRRGQIASDIRAGQTVELQNNQTNNQTIDTPGDMTNAGTLIHGGSGAGLGANIFRIGGLFQNLTLTNTGTYIARNDNASQLGGFRTILGTLDNFGSATVEPFVNYRAFATINSNNFTVQPDGVVQLTAGQSFTQSAGTLTNNGTFDLNGGTFYYNGGDVTGNPIIADGTLIFGAGFTGGGDFIMNTNGGFGGLVPAAASVRFVGPANIASWVVNASTAPGNIDNRGTIVLDNSLGGFVDLRTLNTHTIEATGTLEGDGRLSFQGGPALLLNKGTIAPGGVAGDETGLIRVSGTFTQEATGTLAFQLGGTADTDFDRLTASSAINLAGTLDLSLVPGYTPTIGDSFTLLTGTSRTGAFAGPTTLQLAPGLGGELTYNANSVVVGIVAAAIPGDTDGDGDIDDTDLGTSFANYTGPVGAAGGKTLAQGDADGDGDVDDSDLGTSFAGYTGPLSPTTVPEPASLALMCFGGVMLARRRRRAGVHSAPCREMV